MTVTTSCQHCGTEATASRTMCPSCRRRMQPASISADMAVNEPTTAVAATAFETGQSNIPAPVVMTPLAAPSAFGRALAMSIGIALAGVAGWVILAEAAHVRTALISFGVAAGVAAVMQRFAPHDRRAPVVIVGLTIASALVGLLASQYVLVADSAHVSVMTAVDRIPLSKIPHLLTVGTTAITWIIIALSAYTGFGYARRLTMARKAVQPAASTPEA